MCSKRGERARYWYTGKRECVVSRVHKNKSMQHHTLGSGTAEFQVTWLPKLRKGTYLVKNVRARFEYRKTIAAHGKQVIMQEKALARDVRLCTPRESVFLQTTLPLLTMCVYLTFLPLCNLSAIFREEKRKKKRDKRVKVSSINSWHESVVYRAALQHRYTILYNTQKSRYLKFRRARAPYWAVVNMVKRSGVAYSCSYELLVVFTLCVVSKKLKYAHTALRTGPPVGSQDDYMDVLLEDITCYGTCWEIYSQTRSRSMGPDRPGWLA